MDEQEYRNRFFQIIGGCRTRSDGVVEMRDAVGRIRGRYDCRTGDTRDPCGRFLGRGNQLTRLLEDD